MREQNLTANGKDRRARECICTGHGFNFSKEWHFIYRRFVGKYPSFFLGAERTVTITAGPPDWNSASNNVWTAPENKIVLDGMCASFYRTYPSKAIYKISEALVSAGYHRTPIAVQIQWRNVLRHAMEARRKWTPHEENLLEKAKLQVPLLSSCLGTSSEMIRHSLRAHGFERTEAEINYWWCFAPTMARARLQFGTRKKTCYKVSAYQNSSKFSASYQRLRLAKKWTNQTTMNYLAIQAYHTREKLLSVTLFGKGMARHSGGAGNFYHIRKLLRRNNNIVPRVSRSVLQHAASMCLLTVLTTFL